MLQAVLSSKQATILLVLLLVYAVAAILVFFSVKWRMKHSYLHNELFKSDVDTIIYEGEKPALDQDTLKSAEEGSKIIINSNLDMGNCDEPKYPGGEI